MALFLIALSERASSTLFVAAAMIEFASSRASFAALCAASFFASTPTAERSFVTESFKLVSAVLLAAFFSPYRAVAAARSSAAAAAP